MLFEQDFPQKHHQQDYYHKMTGNLSLPVSERTSETILSLPIYPELSAEDRNIVIKVIKAFYSNNEN